MRLNYDRWSKILTEWVSLERKRNKRRYPISIRRITINSRYLLLRHPVLYYYDCTLWDDWRVTHTLTASFEPNRLICLTFTFKAVSLQVEWTLNTQSCGQFSLKQFTKCASLLVNKKREIDTKMLKFELLSIKKVFLIRKFNDQHI